MGLKKEYLEGQLEQYEALHREKSAELQTFSVELTQLGGACMMLRTLIDEVGKQTMVEEMTADLEFHEGEVPGYPELPEGPSE